MAERLPIEPEALLAHADFVRALARSLLRDPGHADDAVQDTWVAALTHPPRDAGRLRAWLARVVRNFAYRSHRSVRRVERREVGAAQPERIPGPAEILEREAVRRRVVDVVLDLEEPFRTVVILRYFEDLPVVEVARRLDVPEGTAASRLHRAHTMLRERLDAEHGDDRRAAALALLLLAAGGGRADGAPHDGSTATEPTRSLPVHQLAGGCAIVLAIAWVGWRVASPSPTPAALGTTAGGASPTRSPAAAQRPEDGADSPSGGAPGGPEQAATRRVPGTGAILVRVVDLSGEALAGAAVRLGPDWADPDGAETLAEWPVHGVGAIAGPDGRARLEIATAGPDRGVCAMLRAQAPGHGPSKPIEVVAIEGRELDCGEIVLVPGRTIRGRVYDAVGHGIAGVAVWAARPSDDGRPLTPPRRAVETDGDGAFVLRDVSPVGVRLCAQHPHYLAVHEDIAPGAVRAEVHLRRGTPVRGVVRHQGRAVAGAVVKCRGDATSEPVWCSSDREGRFEGPAFAQGGVLSGTLQDGELVARAELEVLAHGTDPLAVVLELPPDTEPPGAPIPGRLRSFDLAPEAVPAPEGSRATVRGRIRGGRGAGEDVALIRAGSVVATRRTDPRGNFRFECVAPGSYRVGVLDLLDNEEVRPLQGEATLELHGGDDRGVDLVIPSPARIVGRVTRGDRPLAGMRVTVDGWSVWTDEDGRYALDEVRPERHELRVWRPGYFPVAVDAVRAVRGETTEVDVDVPAHSVRLGLATADGGSIPEGGIAWLGDATWSPVGTRGSVTFDGLEAGSYQIRWRDAGGAWWWAPVSFGDGEADEDFAVTLQRER